MKYSKENFLAIITKYMGESEVKNQMAPGGGGPVALMDRFAGDIWFKRILLDKEEDELIRTAYRGMHFETGCFNFED